MTFNYLCFKVVEDLAATAASNLTSPRVNLTFEPINPQQNLAEGVVFESVKKSLQSLRVIDLVFCSYNINNNNNNNGVKGLNPGVISKVG